MWKTVLSWRRAVIPVIFIVCVEGVTHGPTYPGITDVYKGDEAYRSYPLEKDRLSREKVIVGRDDNRDIVKVYWYDEEGILRRISCPQHRTILHIEPRGGYHLTEAYSSRDGDRPLRTMRVVGDSLDKLNTHMGGSGLADAALQYSGLETIVQLGESSVARLSPAISKYQQQTGKLLTAEQFMSPVDVQHPLMVEVEDLGLQDFFDAFGDRLCFEPHPDGTFTVS